MLKKFSGLLTMGFVLALYDLVFRDYYEAWISATRPFLFWDAVTGYLLVIILGYLLGGKVGKRVG